MKNTLCYILSSVIILTISCNKTESFNSLQNSSTSNRIKATANGLVAWYTFNGDTLDHSGFGNNVSFNVRAVPAPGKNGVPNTAYYFNGHSYMRVFNSSSLNPRQGITLAVVIKPMNFYQGLCHGNRVINKGFEDQTYGTYFIGFDDQLYYHFDGCLSHVMDTLENFYATYGNGQSTNVSGRDSSNYITKNRWYTIVFTADSSKVGKLYVNGTLRSTLFNSTAAFRANNDDLYIGKMDNDQYPYWFTGIIDEIRIYNKAFNADAIKNLSGEMGK
jgi:hypothetical protein